jgi:hypothetical protein
VESGAGERKAAERAVTEAGCARYTYRLRVSSAEQAARYGSDGCTESSPWRMEKLNGPDTLVLGSEAAWVSTNDTALYGLAAIENLVLLGDRMPPPKRFEGSPPGPVLFSAFPGD